MNFGETRRNWTNKARRYTAPLLFAIALTSCSEIGVSNVDAAFATTTVPTAAERARLEGGSVSQFPTPTEGVDGSKRYCREIGAKIILASEQSVTCEASGTLFTLAPDEKHGDQTIINRQVCLFVKGDIVPSAPTPGALNTVEACHTKQSS